MDISPKGACVPSLGLSNKAVFSSNNQDKRITDQRDLSSEDSYFSETQMTGN